jgi:hypothetical protein
VGLTGEPFYSNPGAAKQLTTYTSSRSSKRSWNKAGSSPVFSLEPINEIHMSDDKSLQSRRKALKRLAYGGAGTLLASADIRSARHGAGPINSK